MNIIADTNVLARVILQDDEHQAALAADLLRQAHSLAVTTVTLC